MQLISANANSFSLNKAAERMKEFLKEKGVDNDIQILKYSREHLNTSADVVVLVKQFNTAQLASVMLLSEPLKDKNRQMGDKQSPWQLPAVPSDVCASPNFRKVTRAAILKSLNATTDEQQKRVQICTPQATPIYLDLTEEKNIDNITAAMFNQIATTHAAATNTTLFGFTKVQNKDDREKLLLTVNYNTSEELFTDDFGFDLRSDITVDIGKVARTNDNLGENSSQQYGKLNAYFDTLYHPQALPNSNQGWGLQDSTQKTHYVARMVLRNFEGPDAHATLGHDLLALASATAVTQDKRALLQAMYPEYSMPKDHVSLKNVGALAADVKVAEKVEVIRTQDKKFLPEMYVDLMTRLYSQQIHIGQYLRPFGPRANTHSTWYDAAVGSEDTRRNAQQRILQAASVLTGGEFPIAKWKNKPIYRKDSTTVLFDGTWHNPITGRWEDLSKLQDTVAMANLLLASNPNAGQTELNKLRAFGDLLLPNRGNLRRLHELKEILVQVTGGPQAKGVRINDTAYIPLMDKDFLDDLTSALNEVVSGRLQVNGPAVQGAEQRGETAFDFGANGFGLGSGGFGQGGGNSPFGSGFDNFNSSGW